MCGFFGLLEGRSGLVVGWSGCVGVCSFCEVLVLGRVEENAMCVCSGLSAGGVEGGFSLLIPYLRPLRRW